MVKKKRGHDLAVNIFVDEAKLKLMSFKNMPGSKFFDQEVLDVDEFFAKR